MIFYRLVTRRYASEAWTGNGANQFGGRWNQKGHQAIYVSTSIALASLEVLVHVKNESILNQYQLYSIELADEYVEYLDNQWLPEDWRENPAPLSTMDLGTSWLEAQSAIALIIPSCIVPYENNAIINPLHPEFSKTLSTVKELDFAFDPRLSGTTAL